MPAVRKVVFPVAGLGTRFLPATKSVPKEMLAVVNKPLLQYAVDEAVDAGIEQFIFVVGRGKNAIEDYFDIAFELEATQAARGKDLSALDGTRFSPGEAIFIRQQEPLGLGHAIWCARHVIGQEPFAVVLPDEFMHGKPGCLAQMMNAYDEVGGNIVSVLEVPPEATSSYGVIVPGAQRGALIEINGMVEKPAPGTAPSNLILPGRYILQPEILQRLEGQARGAGGEIQLTDAMASLIGDRNFHGVKFNGQRFDCGSIAGFIEANLVVAIEREDIGDHIRQFAKRLVNSLKD